MEDEAYRVFSDCLDLSANDFQLEMEYDSDGKAVATFYYSFEVPKVAICSFKIFSILIYINSSWRCINLTA